LSYLTVEETVVPTERDSQLQPRTLM